MFHIEWLRLFVSWCSLPILVVLSVILGRRRHYQELPIFFCYLVVTSISTFVRLVVFIASRPSEAHPFVYAYTYWISSLIGSVLGLLVVYEIFVRRLFVAFYKIRFYRYLFPSIALAVILVTTLTAFLSPDQPWKLIGATDRILVLIRVISLGFFTFLMIVMGRQWQRYELATAFGFAIIAAPSLFTSIMWVKNDNKDSLVSYLPTIAWDIACVIWLVAFGKSPKPQQREPLEPINPEALEEAKKWEGALKNWLATPKKKQR